jgi:hypothetical protein
MYTKSESGLLAALHPSLEASVTYGDGNEALELLCRGRDACFAGKPVNPETQ